MIHKQNTSDKLVFLSLVLFFVLMGIFYIHYGRVFLDAGFYLNAAWRVMQGDMPYRDFFYVQGPVYPYVYGLPLRIIGFSVMHARWVSLAFGLAAVILAAWTARRTGGGIPGAVIALAALTTVPHHAYFFISVKLYSLTAFFFMSAVAVLASSVRARWRYAVGMVLVLIAAATRLTLLPAVPVIGGLIILDAFRKNGRFPWTALVAVLGAGAGLSLPFLIADRQAVIYNLIGIHTSAEAGPYLFSAIKQMKVIGKLVLFYPILTLAVGTIGFHLVTGYRRVCDAVTWIDGVMVSSVFVVTAVHLTANWFSMGYQSILMPVTAAWAGSVCGRLMRRSRFTRFTLVSALLVSIVAGGLGWRDPVWRTDVSAMRSLAFIGQVIREAVPENRSVAGCNAVFAFEAGRLPAGAFGGAPFTYTPGWDEA
ncbi:hypothetical protein JXA80_10735, partial [bacterium]|nr:hypothetical protein [candidate division CSSED10-310 bacterium]